MATAYQERNAILKRLGFSGYAAYLESDLWRRVRAAAWKEHGSKCKICGWDATEIHHLDYSEEVLTGDDLQSLVPLCNGCHIKVEFRDGVKRSFDAAVAEYRRLGGIGREVKCGECGAFVSGNVCDACKRKWYKLALKIPVPDSAVVGRIGSGRADAAAFVPKKRKSKRRFIHDRHPCIDCKVNLARVGTARCLSCAKLNLSRNGEKRKMQ